METVTAVQPATSGAETVRPSKKMIWSGRIMSTVPVLMLLLSCGFKLAKPALCAEGFKHLGIPESFTIGLGLLELACTVTYLVPRTAVLGAILLTGYLGGAILAHLRVGDPIFTHIILGVLLWGGLFLRDPRVRILIPLRKPLA